MGLGGAYHSGLEVGGREYAFGGHFNEGLGIMRLQRPVFQLRQEAEEAVQAGEGEREGGKRGCKGRAGTWTGCRTRGNRVKRQETWGFRPLL